MKTVGSGRSAFIRFLVFLQPLVVPYTFSALERRTAYTSAYSCKRTRDAGMMPSVTIDVYRAFRRSSQHGTEWTVVPSRVHEGNYIARNLHGELVLEAARRTSAAVQHGTCSVKHMQGAGDSSGMYSVSFVFHYYA